MFDLVLRMAICLLLCIGFVGCKKEPTNESQKDNTSTGPAFRITAASYALQFLTQRIAGEKVNVEFPVPRDQDPKTWKPTIEQIQEMQSADLLVINGQGADYAKWLVRVSLVDSKVCDSASELDTSDYIFVSDYEVVHTHGPEGEHSHAYAVPYPWLDPLIAKKQAATITESLKRTYPDMAATFETNLKTLNEQLDELQGDFEEAKKSLTNKEFVSVNPETEFFTRALSLDGERILLFKLNEAKEISSQKRKLQELVERLTESGNSKVNVLFGSFGLTRDELAKQLNLAEFSGVRTIELDLLDHPPETGDYFSAMRSNLKAVGRNK